MLPSRFWMDFSKLGLDEKSFLKTDRRWSRFLKRVVNINEKRCRAQIVGDKLVE